MAEYIEREKAIDYLMGIIDRPNHPEWLWTDEICGSLNSIPAADVRPVVKAHWYWDKDGMDWGLGAWRCSACKTMSPMWWNCDKSRPTNKSGHSFCPNCVATDGGKTDE